MDASSSLCNFVGFNRLRGKTKFINQLTNQPIEYQISDLKQTHVSYEHEGKLVYNQAFLDNAMAKHLSAKLVIYDRVS